MIACMGFGFTLIRVANGSNKVVIIGCLAITRSSLAKKCILQKHGWRP